MRSPPPPWWWGSSEPAAARDVQGLRSHVQADLQEADHAAVPGVQAPGLSAVPRPAPAVAARERDGEVRRLLSLRGRLPGGLHPGGRRREHAGQPRLARRALRADLRDQPQPLHLLRLLRARVPVRRDHARQRVRDLGAQPRRPDLHEGHAAHAAGEGMARRGRGSLRHADPLLQERLVIVASAGNVLVWIVWFAAAFACVGSAVAVISFANPFFSALALIGNLGSLAVMYLLLSAEFVAAAQVLVYAGAVVVMFLFVIAYVGPRRETPWSGGPSWQTFAAVAAAGALLGEIVPAGGMAGRAGGGGRRRGDAGERQPLAPEQRRLHLRHPRLDRARLPRRPPARLRDH